ncbi:MAG: ribonuclease III [Firmicutes bacterium]|nr:ribonuclease III [Bacillota bacterium]
MKVELQEWIKTYGIALNNPSWLNQALRHSSYVNEIPTAAEDNERLEFLGDAVLGLLVADELFRRYPQWPEGELTRRRAIMVQERSLADCARALHLPDLLQLGHGEERAGGRQRDSVLCDTLEAVIGALYIDQGYAFIQTFFQKHLLPLLSKEEVHDYKSQLQEVVQASGKGSIHYDIVESSGPPHQPTFVAEVQIGDTIRGRGSGSSKQRAEQQAAADALQKLQATSDAEQA